MHRDLAASDIRKLVAELGGVSILTKDLVNYVTLAGGFVLQRFARGKRLSASDLQDIFENADQIVGSDIAPCGRWRASREANRFHPNGQKMEAAYMIICTDGANFQLYAIRIEGSQKKVRFEITGIPFGFTYHTAERYLERYGKTDYPLNAIGRGLVDYAFCLFVTGPFARDRNAGHMNIPAPDGSGIFLGEFKDFNSLSYCLEFDCYGGRKLPVDNVFLTRSPIFVAQTFVDRHQMRPEQTAAAQMLADWTAEYRRDLDTERDNLLWSHAKLLPVGFTPREQERAETLRTKLIEILADARFQDGIKPYKDFVPTISHDDFLARVQTALKENDQQDVQ